MYEIFVTNSQASLSISEALLHEVAEHTLKSEQILGAEISIVLVDNAQIHELNRQFLNHDYETDVLSFLLECEELSSPQTEPGNQVTDSLIREGEAPPEPNANPSGRNNDSSIVLHTSKRGSAGASRSQTGSSGMSSKPRGAGKRIEGEVILSTEMAVTVAKEIAQEQTTEDSNSTGEWTAENEALLYLVHGLLHLAGYDDLTPEEKQLMRQRERDILQHWQLIPHYAESEPPGDSSGHSQPTGAGTDS